MIFHRYHGLGNDYLVCHQSVAALLSNEQIQRILRQQQLRRRQCDAQTRTGG
ncbi:hypothetical protein [Rahnella bruchi]|uniref:hypothetical protein n=1 Tax=Rahnella bruchi TaxID=1510573 RepID=UPI0013C43DAD|nr:hypothetical protein [Rahnella bruchi]